MGTENRNKAVSSLCKVKPEFFDPIDLTDKDLQIGNILTQEKGVISMSPKFTGYFGYCRGSNIYGAYMHDGCDYLALNDTGKPSPEIKAVYEGIITHIRFGHNSRDSKCLLKDDFNRTPIASFNANRCKGCDNRKGCYGIQVWLQVDVDGTQYYAYYAHLSELSSSIFSAISKKKINNVNNTLILSESVCGDDVIGRAGCTGIACDSESKQHLHFECRTGLEIGTQISPNKIVKTEFKIITLPIEIIKKIKEQKETSKKIKETEIKEDTIKKEIREDILKIINGADNVNKTLKEKIEPEDIYVYMKKENMSTEKVNKEIEKEIEDEINSKIRGVVFKSIEKTVVDNWKKAETYNKQVEFVKSKWKEEISFPKIKDNKDVFKKKGWTEEQKKLWEKIYNEEWIKTKENGKSEKENAYDKYKEGEIEEELGKNGGIYKAEIIKAFWKNKLAGKEANNALNEFRINHELIVGNIKKTGDRSQIKNVASNP